MARPASVERSSRQADGGMGCLMLFGAPFLLGGLASLWTGYNEWSSGSPGENWWVTLVVGAMFALVGGGIIAGAYYGRGKLLEQQQLQRQYPDQPWMWRPDWAKGRVDSDAQTTMYFAWGFAGFWNAIAWVSAIAGWEQLSGFDDPRLLLLGLFPLIGVGLAAWAVTATLRHRKFGVSRLELSTLPGAVGGRLAGRIDTKLPEPPADGIQLNLDCIRKVRSGRNNTREHLLWKTDKHVPAPRLSRGWQGVSIPFEFAIPADAQETTRSAAGNANRVLWRLSAGAEMAGVDFQARFETPVFRTGEEQAAAESAGDAWRFASDREPEFDLQDATFIQRPSPLGGVEYYFPPRSQQRGAAGSTVFLVVWLGALWAMTHFGVPWFFQLIWGLFALLILLAALDAWFGRTTIRIEGGRIHAAHGTLGRGKMRSIGFGEISRITTDVGSTQSESMTQSSKAWWNVKAARKGGGRDFAIAQNLRNRREAEWLAERMRERIDSA